MPRSTAMDLLLAMFIVGLMVKRMAEPLPKRRTRKWFARAQPFVDEIEAEDICVNPDIEPGYVHIRLI